MYILLRAQPKGLHASTRRLQIQCSLDIHDTAGRCSHEGLLTPHNITECVLYNRHSITLIDVFAGLGSYEYVPRSDFAGASTTESCLLFLSRPPTWRPALYTTISQCLDTGLEDMDLSSVFGLLVFAGFPKVGLWRLCPL